MDAETWATVFIIITEIILIGSIGGLFAYRIISYFKKYKKLKERQKKQSSEEEKTNED